MPSLQQAITTFLQIERRPATNLQYRRVLEQMAEAIGPANQVERISYEILLDYQAALRQRVNASTVAGYSSVMKSFFNWCARRNYCSVSPAADLIRKKPRKDLSENRAVPPDELRRMIEYARVTSARNYAILLLLADSGCRVGALCSLTWKNLHLDSFYADAVEKGGVPGRLLFGEETAAALATWKKEWEQSYAADYPFVFGIKRGAVEALIKTISRKAKCSRDWFPHAFRHAVGHAYARAGVPATITARKLNQRDVGVTLNYYYPTHDPYLESVSQRLSLASLKSEEELRSPRAASVTPLRKTGTT